MKFRKENIDGVTVVRVEESRLDSNISSEVKTELLSLVENEGAQKILIDLKEVDYVDSSGLGALLFGHRQAKLNSGHLKLVNLNPKIATLISIAKLENILEGFSSEKEALKSFQNGQ
ncbi:MAG: STAS domain-containing protein [bacterium]